MFGGVIAVLLCAWLHQTATRIHRNPLPWIIGALMVFYGIRYAWTFAFLKPVMGADFQTHTMLTGVLMELSGALIAAGAVALFRSTAMPKRGR